MQSVHGQAQAHECESAYKNPWPALSASGNAVCQLCLLFCDVLGRSGVLILHKLAEKGSITSGRPGLAPGRNVEHCSI